MKTNCNRNLRLDVPIPLSWAQADLRFVERKRRTWIRVMGGEPLINQRFIGRRELRIIQLERSSNQKLTLLEC